MTEPDGVEELAGGPLDLVDESVLSELAHLYDTLDPVPAGLVDRIRFGITLDALNAELARIERSDVLAGARGEETAADTITFTSANLTTMITISVVSPETARIDGWVAPGGGATVELRAAEQTLSAVADENGRFVFEAAPRGRAQFVVRHPEPSGLPPVLTPPIEI